MIQIGPVTAEILLPKRLCGGWVVVCKLILVFSLSLGQAEQHLLVFALAEKGPYIAKQNKFRKIPLILFVIP